MVKRSVLFCSESGRDSYYFGCLGAFGSFSNFKFHCFAFVKAFVTFTFYNAVMHEHIIRYFIGLDKSISF